MKSVMSMFVLCMAIGLTGCGSAPAPTVVNKEHAASSDKVNQEMAEKYKNFKPAKKSGQPSGGHASGGHAAGGRPAGHGGR